LRLRRLASRLGVHLDLLLLLLLLSLISIYITTSFIIRNPKASSWTAAVIGLGLDPQQQLYQKDVLIFVAVKPR
jgi:hypothetical protein